MIGLDFFCPKKLTLGLIEVSGFGPFCVEFGPLNIRKIRYSVKLK